MSFIFLLFTLLHLFVISDAQDGGELNLLTLSSSSILTRSNNGYRNIPISTGFRFGVGTVYNVYVSINGYISMGTPPSSTSPSIPGTNNIVSPYGADIDTSTTGTVSYTSFSFTTSTQLSTVSSFIRRTTDSSFYGNSMMIAEWDRVPEHSQSTSVTSTFQAVLITNGTTSYAVFIYECGEIGWGGAAIGWVDSSTVYSRNSFSGSTSTLIACHHSLYYSAYVYRLDQCLSSQFTCDNQVCVSSSSVCDGDNDCGDNSDEQQNCGCLSQFTCDNGDCVSSSYVCDGDNDCGDYSDEEENCGGSSDTLDFLTLSSPVSLDSSDEDISSSIYTGGSFKFGDDYVSYVYVSTNGYISMGTSPSTNHPVIPGTYDIVSPYGANIDTRIAGTVSYSSFSSTTSSQLSTVSSFIRSQTDSSFYGNSMMIAEWNGVPKYGGSSSVTSTFQAVLITDGSISYAVFIYKCGGMGWEGATIGWAYSSSIYEEHSLSGSSSDSIGSCYGSSTYRTVVYKLKMCSDNDFTCDNGDCEPSSFVCDDYDDCGDNSDEQNCSSTSVGVAVGVSLSVLFLIFIGIPICILLAVRRSARRRPVLRGRIVATTPASGATVVTTTNTTTTAPATATTSNIAYPSQTAPNTQPTTYPAQQPPEVYKDAQFSYGVAPPSYDAAVAFPAAGYAQYPGAAYPPPTTAAPYPDQPPPQPGYPVAQPPPQPGYPAVTPYPSQAYPPPTEAYPPPPT